MTPEQDQWIRLIEDRLNRIEDSCFKAEELQQVQNVISAVEVLKTILKERK
jgi:hypothetical protein